MLENNAQEMKTVVETYFIEETMSLTHNPDDLTKWNDLVAFLELPKQAELAKEEKSPIPFLWMNEQLIAVFETLCPSKVDVAQYNKTPIPLQTLEIVALCKREGYFDLIEVWYDEKSPDPALIGWKFDNTRKEDWTKKYYAERYLLAKWSDVKASLSELADRAHKRFITESTIQLQVNIKRYQRDLEDLHLEAAKKFGILPGKAAPELPF